MRRTAVCCCEETTIEVEGDPKLHVVCHCDNCKRRTGSAFGVSVYFMNSQIKNIGGTTFVYKISTDTTEQERYFCKSCGTTLYWKISKFDAIPNIGDMTGIAGGCFEDNSLPEPTMSATSTRKCTWVEIPKLKIVS